jgi:quinol monooxygenase YgiN
VIVVHVEVKIDLAKEEQARAAALVMQEATRAEPGCVSYRFVQAVDDPSTILVLEAWEDQASMDAHGQTEHLAEFLVAMAEVVAGPVTVTTHHVSETTTHAM